MKSQGLPLNFIVLAALAILILILAAAFILMGGKSIQRTMSPPDRKSELQKYLLRHAEICFQDSLQFFIHGYY